MKHKLKKRVTVGDYTCCPNDAMEGIIGYTPAEIVINCKHRDYNYIADRCKYMDDCCFKREVDEKDFKEYPELFKESKE